MLEVVLQRGPIGGGMSRSLRDGLKPVRDLPLLLEQTDSLDQLAQPVQEALTRAVVAGSTLNEALSVTALGHPLHPPLTDVVIGAWTSALVLDCAHGCRVRH
jgi:hypothetical protein